MSEKSDRRPGVNESAANSAHSGLQMAPSRAFRCSRAEARCAALRVAGRHHFRLGLTEIGNRFGRRWTRANFTAVDRFFPTSLDFISDEHTSELQSPMRSSSAVFFLKKQKK